MFTAGVDDYLTESDMPPDFSGSGLPSPYLRIRYNIGVVPPVETSSPVLCVSADPKQKTALAGTHSGNLWKIQYDGSEWLHDKMHSFDSPVKAIYMDIKRNFQDYPSQQITWVGLEDGTVYRSINSLLKFSEITNITNSDSIVEIRGSELDTNKVVIASTSSLFITKDGGSSWITWSRVGNITGLFVRGDEIQVSKDNGYHYRSPNFGAFWYLSEGTPASCTDTAFNINNKENSFIVGSSKVYVYEKRGASNASVFNYKEGASLTGTGVVGIADFTGTAYIGTTSKLYRSVDWGNTVEEVKVNGISMGIIDVAVGGDYPIEA
jgi:hypothetical protein